VQQLFIIGKYIIFNENVNIYAYLNSPGEQLFLSREGEILSSAKDLAGPDCVCLLAGAAFCPDIPCPVLDLYELFAFVRPAQPIYANTKSFYACLGIESTDNLAEDTANLFVAVDVLLNELAKLPPEEKKAAADIAYLMREKGKWIWANFVLNALGTKPPFSPAGLSVWDKLGEWEETGPIYHATSIEIDDNEVKERLNLLLNNSTEKEERKQQTEYALTVCEAFSAINEPNCPQTVLAEAGTGVGKTLGYIAPASVWADKNTGQVWISTYTKNLQHQIASELQKLFAGQGQKTDDATKKRKIVVRKGRENYVCLLNYADAVNRIYSLPTSSRRSAVILGLVARWLYKTQDGDLIDGDFPNILINSDYAKFIRTLTDKRGECIYSLCPYFKKCFVEKIIRRAKNAKIVVANHALVMATAAGLTEESIHPTRFIFDEGHHLFSACDSAFSSMLSGQKSLDMQYWLFGENASRTANKGLKRRLADLCSSDSEIKNAVEDLLHDTDFLCKTAWLTRVENGNPNTIFEKVLALIRRQVIARRDSRFEDDIYDLETEPLPLIPSLKESAKELSDKIAKSQKDTSNIKDLIQSKLVKEADTLSAAEKQRYESVIRQLQRKISDVFIEWLDVLSVITNEANPIGKVSRMVIAKQDGRTADIAMYKHFINPLIPFAGLMKTYAHGILITSATLKDKTGNTALDWEWAEERTGAKYINPNNLKASIPSPFDYPSQTKVILLSDVKKGDNQSLAAAMLALFKAAGGGAIGLFTAIKRLKAVYKIMQPELMKAGLPLFAQHVMDINNTALINMFKENTDSCLLGTDAVRDGIDIPGDSLRLVVLDKLPWNRPDILHKARRKEFSKCEDDEYDYDKRLIRMKFIQGFGRLIRKNTDKGIFVIPDKSVPSKLLSAFPENVQIIKCDLPEAVKEVQNFLRAKNKNSQNI